MYKMLYVISATSGCNSNYIVKKFGKELFSTALQKGYIQVLRKNEIGEDLYFITDVGKNYIKKGGE